MTTPPTISRVKWRPCLESQACTATFKRSQKANTLIKACEQLLVINFYAKGNSEDPFAVAVTKSELIVAQVAFQKNNNPLFARCFYDKVGSIPCRWIRCSVAMRLAFSTWQAKIFGEEIFAGTNFRDLAFDRENCEISASRKFPAIRYVGKQYFMYVHYQIGMCIDQKAIHFYLYTYLPGQQLANIG